MTDELRYAARYPLVASVDVLDLQTGARITARTSDLSLTGCFVDTLNPLPSGTKVRLNLAHGNGICSIVGTVAHSMPNLGMGVKFDELDQIQQQVLQSWLITRSK